MKPKIMQITAGVGPVEARRFVALLGDYLATWCVHQSILVHDVVVCGAEAEPHSVELHVTGDDPTLCRWAGTHVLVAKSERRSKRSRKRWYVGVSVSDDTSAPEPPALEVRADEVTISAMRAGGPGGQNVNKTSTAVRVAHKATGVTVRVSDERSQRDNVRIALRRLARVLSERAQDERAAARAGRRMRHYRLERGRPAYAYELDRNGELTLCEVTCLK